MRMVFFISMLLALLVVAWLTMRDVQTVKQGTPAAMAPMQRAEDARKRVEAADQERAKELDKLGQ